MEYGLLTLLPIVVVVALALLTKRTLEPLIAGSFTAYIINGLHFPPAWADAFFNVASNREYQWVFMVCALFGSLIALLGASHGTIDFSRWLRKLCRGPKSTLIVTWIMGVLIFVDDYLIIMTVSTSMQRMSDHHKVPREALTYIIASTGAPVCTLLPFSTWAVFFAAMFYSETGGGGAGLRQSHRHLHPHHSLYFLRHLRRADGAPVQPGLYEAGLPAGTGDGHDLLRGQLGPESGGGRG